MILVVGGAGYTGSVLVRELLKKGHKVRVVDVMWFGNQLDTHSNLEIVEKMYDQISFLDMDGVDCVVHLANVANDPSVDLAPVLSWEINVLHFKSLLDLCRRSEIDKFIYASSGSVYGVKTEDLVTEELDLVPISVYNKTKMIAERVLRSYKDDFKVFALRPATVCGPSPRMRFDVLVNMFVKQARFDGKIKVFGGDQIRPNIHIEDLAKAYIHIMESDIPSGEYNAGFENLSVMQVANMVKRYIECEVEIFESNDPRSYRQDSSKLLNTGFIPSKGVDLAIQELINAFDSGSLRDDPRCYTVNWMKEKGIGVFNG